jgi:hypothetical protein
VGLSLRAFARMLGVTHQTVRKAIARGRLVPLADGTIDPEAADRTWPRGAPSETHDVPNAAPLLDATGAFDGLALDRARAAKTAIEAQRAKLELDHRRGTLISREKAVGKAFTFARMLRDRWQAWPARVRRLLAAQFDLDAGAVTVVLEGLVREHLAELASERCEF